MSSELYIFNDIDIGHIWHLNYQKIWAMRSYWTSWLKAFFNSLWDALQYSTITLMISFTSQNFVYAFILVLQGKDIYNKNVAIFKYILRLKSEHEIIVRLGVFFAFCNGKAPWRLAFPHSPSEKIINSLKIIALKNNFSPNQWRTQRVVNLKAQAYRAFGSERPKSPSQIALQPRTPQRLLCRAHHRSTDPNKPSLGPSANTGLQAANGVDAYDRVPHPLFLGPAEGSPLMFAGGGGGSGSLPPLPPPPGSYHHHHHLFHPPPPPPFLPPPPGGPPDQQQQQHHHLVGSRPPPLGGGRLSSPPPGGGGAGGGIGGPPTTSPPLSPPPLVPYPLMPPFDVPPPPSYHRQHHHHHMPPPPPPPPLHQDNVTHNSWAEEARTGFQRGPRNHKGSCGSCSAGRELTISASHEILTMCVPCGCPSGGSVLEEVLGIRGCFWVRAKKFIDLWRFDGWLCNGETGARNSKYVLFMAVFSSAKKVCLNKKKLMSLDIFELIVAFLSTTCQFRVLSH